MADAEKTNLDSAKNIVKDAEGYYRWIYEVDSSTNQSFLKLYLLIFALIILIPGMILFIMISGKGGDMGQYLLIWLAVFAGVELLTVLIYKGIEKLQGGVTEMPYLMGEDFIVVHPGNEWTPTSYLKTNFSSVKDIKVDPGSDLILLNEIARVTHVYVPRQDFLLVLNYILDRLPQTGKIQKRRQEYQELHM
jgi:hypothetical protein